MKKAILYLLAFLAIQVIGGGVVQGIWFLVSGSAERTAGQLITTTAVCSLRWYRQAGCVPVLGQYSSGVW